MDEPYFRPDYSRKWGNVKLKGGSWLGLISSALEENRGIGWAGIAAKGFLNAVDESATDG